MESPASQSSQRKLGVFTLAMMSVSAIIALRNLPMLAEQGWASVFFLSVASVLFFIPISLVSAELASGWPDRGGIYAWVKHAFGDDRGAYAIWFEWIESVVWLPVVLSFIAASLAYIVNPELAQNRVFLISVMLVVLWSGTFLNFLSIKTSGLVSSLGIIIGSIIPGICVIALGCMWLASGNQVEAEFSTAALLPEMRLDNLVLFTEILLGFAGIEVAAFHIRETKDPRRTFPRATFISAFIIIVIYVLGSVSIALVVPKEQITYHAGVMQAFEVFLAAFNLSWALPVLASLAVIGALALVNTWIIGPSKGLLASALDGEFPKFTTKTNKQGSPVVILMMQAMVATALSLPYLFMPTVKESYWILNTLAAQLILMMYFLIFIAAIKLKLSHPKTPRAYQIPGGKLGMWIVAGTGTLSCVGAFFLGFVPPASSNLSSTTYPLVLVSGIVILSLPPFICQALRRAREG